MILLVFIFLHFVQFSYSASFGGEYQMIPSRLSKCDVSDFKDIKKEFTEKIFLDNYKIRKLNRTTFVYTGNADIKIDVDDSLSLRMDVSIWGNGGWRPNFMTLVSPHVCKGLKQYIPFYYESIFADRNLSCPLKSGQYFFENLPMRYSKSQSMIFPYGQFKVVVKVFDKSNKVVFCIVAEVIIKSQDRV